MHPSSLPPDVYAEIQRLNALGNKIEAIKRMREATGMGLKEAKDAVEAMPQSDVADLHAGAAPLPMPGTARSNTVTKSGCFSVIALVAAGAGAVVWVAVRAGL